jgi:hypothetical protein
MNKKLLYTLAAGLIFFSACIKKSDEPENTGIVNTAFTYKVSSYKSNGNEFSNTFDGQNFTFGNNDALLAVKNGIVAQGNWRNTNDSIVIKSFVNPPLDLLNQSWSKVFISDIGIELSRVDGVNTYKVMFSKI